MLKNSNDRPFGSKPLHKVHPKKQITKQIVARKRLVTQDIAVSLSGCRANAIARVFMQHVATLRIVIYKNATEDGFKAKGYLKNFNVLWVDD